MSQHPSNYCPVFGNYPKEYNRAVHGPFYPWVNYNQSNDTRLADVKLGDLKSWFARRNKTPAAVIAETSRTYHDWYRKWLGTKFGSPSKGFFQIMFGYSVLCLLGSYGYIREHRMHKYHW